MQTRICKVIAQTEPVYVQSKKSENGQLAKCYIRLRELGGEYEDEYQCALLGNGALCKFAVGKTVVVSLRISWSTRSCRLTNKEEAPLLSPEGEEQKPPLGEVWRGLPKI